MGGSMSHGSAVVSSSTAVGLWPRRRRVVFVSLCAALAVLFEVWRRRRQRRRKGLQVASAVALVASPTRSDQREIPPPPARLPPQRHEVPMVSPASPMRPVPCELPSPPARPPPPPERDPPRAAKSKVVDSKGLDQEIELWVCLDFEWTCDEGENRVVHADEGEIIEFSYAIYDARARKDAGDGQYYCKNTKTPITSFCTDLTGISSETLANAGTLEDALKALDKHLEREDLVGRPACAMTHGSADLELMLPRNCRAHGLEIPPYLQRYVDLREATQSHVAARGIVNRRASTLKQICDVLRVDMLGDEHCGLDDSWMVLLATQQLLKQGATMRINEIAAERAAFLAAVLPQPAIAASQRCLCLDGLPFYATKPEVLEWIEKHVGNLPSEISLWIILGSDTRPSNRALVDFSTHDAAVLTLKALDDSSPMVCGSRERWPFEAPRERLVLARPMREHEMSLRRVSLQAVAEGDVVGPVLAPFPEDSEEIDVVRRVGSPNGKGKGKQKMEAAEGCTGTIKMFDDARGFGFISFSGGEVFVHRSNCHGGQPVQGDVVTFDVTEDRRRGRMAATNVAGGTGPSLQ